MLRLTGRVGDGWLPSMSYLPGGLNDLREMNAMIDEAAIAAGRDPSSIRRLINIGGRFGSTGRGLFDGPPQQWAEQLAEVALEYGMSGFILGGDDPAALELFAREVAPATRELVAAERGQFVGDASRTPLPS